MRTYSNQEVKKVKKMIKAGATYASVSKTLKIPTGTVAYLNNKNVVKKAPKVNIGQKRQIVEKNTTNAWETLANFLRPYLK